MNQYIQKYIKIYITITLIGCALSSSPNKVLATPMSWDYGLTKQCIKSASESAINYYEDTTDCTDDHHWTIAVQSEHALGSSCSGPNNQSLPINTTDSPLSLAWESRSTASASGAKNITLTTDLTSKSHPCDGAPFTWFTLMDHVSLGGGPLAKPKELFTTATLTLTDEEIQHASRVFIGFQGFWGNKAHTIELNVYLGHAWGDNHADADIITVLPPTDSLEFVSMDGRALGFSLAPDTPTTFTIPWSMIIQRLISRGFFSAPNDWNLSATGAVYIGTEMNNFSQTNAGKTVLSISHLKEDAYQKEDIDMDDTISIFDYNLLVTHFGQTGTIGFDRSDINDNGEVDIFDYNSLVGAFIQT